MRLVHGRTFGVVLAALVVFGLVGQTRAEGDEDSQSPDAAQTELPVEDNVSSVTIPETQVLQSVRDYRQAPAMRPGNYLGERGEFDPHPYDHTHLGDGLIFDRDYFDRKNRRWEERGTAIGGYFSPNFQWGSEGGGSHAIGEFLLVGSWETIRNGDRVGRIIFGLAHDQTIGSLTTRKFADNQRIVETSNDLDTDPDKTFTTLGLLAWEHEFWTSEDSGWGYRAGQLFTPAFFGPSVYLDDDRRFFLARPLASAAGAQWVGSNDIGLGAQIVAWKHDLYATFSVIDGDADRKFPDFSSLAEGRLLYLGEVGIERDMDGPNEFAIRFTFTHLDETVRDGTVKPPGESAIISFERKFDDRWALAGRWSKSYRRLTADYQELYSFGLLLLRPFSFDDDSVGLGLFAGDPADSGKGTEYGAEIFYKLRLTQDVSFMPDIQYWHRDDSDGTQVRSWVYGVRLNLDF